jgi:hypothetical protein
VLDRAGFERLVRRVWPMMGSADIDNIFRAADTDEDGQISAAELVAWGDAHGGESALFRQTFLGFSGELGMLQLAQEGTQVNTTSAATVATAAMS